MAVLESGGQTRCRRVRIAFYGQCRSRPRVGCGGLSHRLQEPTPMLKLKRKLGHRRMGDRPAEPHDQA